MHNTALCIIEWNLPLGWPFTSKSDCSWSMSLLQLIAFDSLVSSANLDIAHRRLESISLIKIKNNTGPKKTEPWGTPLVTAVQEEKCPFIQTLCFLLCSHSLSQFQTLPEIPCLLIFSNSRQWGTLSIYRMKKHWYLNALWSYVSITFLFTSLWLCNENWHFCRIRSILCQSVVVRCAV